MKELQMMIMGVYVAGTVGTGARHLGWIPACLWDWDRGKGA